VATRYPTLGRVAKGHDFGAAARLKPCPFAGSWSRRVAHPLA